MHGVKAALLSTDMSEKDEYGDGLGYQGAPHSIPPRAAGGRRSGISLPRGGQDTEAPLPEAVKAAPRRSSIIKVRRK